MKIIQIINIILIGACFNACTCNKTEENGIIINLDENVKESILYSSFVDSIEYIPLEANDDCLIGKIRDVIISDSIIFVLNIERRTIFLFKKDGTFINKISHIGNGPGEYRAIKQFTYNKTLNCISAASVDDKIIEYNLSGDLIKEFRTTCNIADLYKFDNGDYLISRIGDISKPNDIVFLMDSNGVIKESLIKKKPLYNIESFDRWELSSFKNEVHFISPQLDNIMYCYKEKTLTNKLNFIFLPKISSEFYEKQNNQLGLGDNYYRTIYRESTNWIHLGFWSQSKDVRIFLYNKKNNQYIIGKEFNNDMDNIKKIEYLSASENNTFTGYFITDKEDENPILQILHLK